MLIILQTEYYVRAKLFYSIHVHMSICQIGRFYSNGKSAETFCLTRKLWNQKGSKFKLTPIRVADSRKWTISQDSSIIDDNIWLEQKLALLVAIEQLPIFFIFYVWHK